MDGKATEEQLKNNAPEETSEKKRGISVGTLLLSIIGVAAAGFFAALMVWISVGASAVQEQQKRGGGIIVLTIRVVASKLGIAPAPEHKTAAPREQAFMGRTELRPGVCKVFLPAFKYEDVEFAPTMELAEVKAGKFMMSYPVTPGCERRVERDPKSGVLRIVGNEKPHEAVLTRDFYLGRTEVTQGQWIAVMGRDGVEAGKSKKSYFFSTPEKDDAQDDYGAPCSRCGALTIRDKHVANGSYDLPVEMVSWNEALAFCEKLNKLKLAPEGWMFTLPTETQWEFAARGGVAGKGYKYSGGNDLKEVAWCKSNNGRDEYGLPAEDKEIRKALEICRKLNGSGAAPDGMMFTLGRSADKKREKNRPVGQKKPNELGLYDMNGNVWEWCLDDFVCEALPQTDKDGKPLLDQDGEPVTLLFLSDSSKAVPEYPPEPVGAFRVIRGGSWYTKDEACTPTVRSPMSPDGRALYLGFRVALVRRPPERKRGGIITLVLRLIAANSAKSGK